jgi:hypothetical protein
VDVDQVQGSRREARVERAVARRLQQEGAAWFPGVSARPAVRLRLISRRPRALLYAARVGSHPAPLVLAKVRLERQGTETLDLPRRPHLAPAPAPVDEQTAREFAGLRAIHERFGTGADSRFGAVRPLAHLRSEHTILMEYLDAPTLRDRLAAQSRLSLPGQREPRATQSPWSSAGAWLRRYHDDVRVPDLTPRQAARDEVVERFDAYGHFLGERLGRGVGDLTRRAARLAEEVLPERLPVAVGHGDFAPRNAFVEQSGRVTVFDPMPRWSVPVYEDLGRFLVGIRLLGGRLHTHGAAYSRRRVEEHELDVISGYWADEPAPGPQLRCYELLVLLDKWSALLGAPAGGRGSGLRGRSVLLATGFVQDEARRLLDLAELDGPSARPATDSGRQRRLSP